MRKIFKSASRYAFKAGKAAMKHIAPVTLGLAVSIPALAQPFSAPDLSPEALEKATLENAGGAHIAVIGSNQLKGASARLKKKLREANIEINNREAESIREKAYDDFMAELKPVGPTQEHREGTKRVLRSVLKGAPGKITGDIDRPGPQSHSRNFMRMWKYASLVVMNEDRREEIDRIFLIKGFYDSLDPAVAEKVYQFIRWHEDAHAKEYDDGKMSRRINASPTLSTPQLTNFYSELGSEIYADTNAAETHYRHYQDTETLKLIAAARIVSTLVTNDLSHATGFELAKHINTMAPGTIDAPYISPMDLANTMGEVFKNGTNPFAGIEKDNGKDRKNRVLSFEGLCQVQSLASNMAETLDPEKQSDEIHVKTIRKLLVATGTASDIVLSNLKNAPQPETVIKPNRGPRGPSQ